MNKIYFDFKRQRYVFVGINNDETFSVSIIRRYYFEQCSAQKLIGEEHLNERGFYELDLVKHLTGASNLQKQFINTVQNEIIKIQKPIRTLKADPIKHDTYQTAEDELVSYTNGEYKYDKWRLIDREDAK